MLNINNIEIPKCSKEFSETDIKIALANYKNFIAKERKRLNLN